MTVRIDEIADGLFRLSIFDSKVAPPAGFTFNHFLFRDDEPLLFHAGKRKLFAPLAEAVAKIVPLDQLRWIGFGHLESDECGAMNEWLAAAPHAELMHGVLACRLSLEDMADRPPRGLTNGEVVATGAKRFRFIETPHVPHGWDAGVLFEETTRTLLCSDLFSQFGQGAPLTESDIVAPACDTRNFVYSTSLGPATVPTLRRLAALAPRTLAVMHGSSYAGDGGAALHALAGEFQAYLSEQSKL